MIRIAPANDTWAVSVTAITVCVPSVRFLSVRLPVPRAMDSLKVAVRFELSSTPLASSTGLRVAIVGGVVSG